MRDKLAQFNRQPVNQGILKNNKPPIPSDLHKNNVSASKISAEQEARLTTREITLGVEKARKALNEPSTDLIAFEEALKKKH